MKARITTPLILLCSSIAYADTTPDPVKIQRYMAVYNQIIDRKLDDVSAFKGNACELTVYLTREGHVEYVDMENQGELCRKAFNAVWSINRFPLPADWKIARELTKFRETIRP
ncbi:cell envelope integrity TolA C-terminal domain-containing protein [Vibrio sp. HA2012]|uniref:cell envelope integrity TolA C-terminal domain-containing protein n=1 Tax=Vibrio sp. HA2012 TaxID=1971595 RepID=UPI0012FD3EDE|nr:cell envelope integrity TolA C-terminal domain-containing protein [Vibrio sp. HA2012]